MANAMSRSGMYVFYQLNRAVIAATLCEERAVPESTCQGSCYLKKELKKAQEQNKQTHRHFAQGTDLVLFLYPLAAPLKEVSAEIKTQKHTYLAGSSSEFSMMIFHPPAYRFSESTYLLSYQENQV